MLIVLAVGLIIAGVVYSQARASEVAAAEPEHPAVAHTREAQRCTRLAAQYASDAHGYERDEMPGMAATSRTIGEHYMGRAREAQRLARHALDG